MKVKRMLLIALPVVCCAVVITMALPQQGSGTPTPMPTPTSTPHEMDGMVPLPGGTFMMGCVEEDNRCQEDEKPQHQVTLNSFSMDVHEVTIAEYAQCVNAGACKEPRASDDQWAEFYNWKKPGRENHPVNGVDWNDADTYCRWRQKRLPTEAELEYALRGGSQGNIYPWGNDATPPAGYGNYPDESACRRFPDWTVTFPGYDDGYASTSPVCSFTRNPYGLCDISGNVWEWAADWYGKKYYQSSEPNNPRGPSSGMFRAVRGSSWVHDPGSERTSDRVLGDPESWSNAIGFRCSRN